MPKNVGSIVCKGAKFFQKAKKSKKAFSLIELMVSSAIGLIVALAISSVYIFALDFFYRLVAMNNAQEQLLWTAYHTRNLFSQAVNITDNNVAGGSGFIYHTSTTRFGLIKPVAGFMREMGNSNSDFRQTVIFLQEPGPGPTGDITNMGRVFFDVNTNGVASPSLDDVVTDNIIQYDLRIQGITGATTAQGASIANPTRIVVDIATKHFYKNRTEDFRWCPPGNMTSSFVPLACRVPNGLGSNTLRMQVNVSLRNNFNKSQTGSGGVYGAIYYFQYMPAPIDF